MDMAKMDQKGRIQLPKALRKRLGLKGKETLGVRLKGSEIILSKRSYGRGVMHPVIKDMIEHPLHAKVPVTRELLDRLADEQWSGL